jgi:TRAP-type C4-dicarboxylate transport system permease small subunit
MKILRAVDGWLNKAESALLIVLLIGMVLLAFAQVVMRIAFSTGLIWGDILLRHSVLWIGFLGGALGVSGNRHITIEAFAHFMSSRTRSALSIVTSLFGAAICFLLANAALRFVKDEISSGSSIFGSIPTWYAEIIIPLGFSLFVFHFVVRAANSVEKLMKKEDNG